jgi:predicted small secreted protein
MKIVAIIFVFWLLLVLSGCQTVNGLGKDLQMMTEPYVVSE